MRADDQNWLKKQAFQIVSQLPDEAAQSWEILGYVTQMVSTYFGPPPPPRPKPTGRRVIHFPVRSRSPRRRASSSGRPSTLPK